MHIHRVHASGRIEKNNPAEVEIIIYSAGLATQNEMNYNTA